ncbi:4-(cytidine 5'-diphospho)-2-C-methyl-D-erythritol kinase [Algoriphagus sediminis]|uniref:4-diphosphocytidyl-2-C-methyl-D-erythritol kinase n=1 Tax=Algoriphagus sediminis TaxID=3057113 RepID=A0ABT7YF39_9BACT|nr:4-(cytidine 5'-diphospho)-2-C-methyl-D-erythritol kinase [Algoriphagus sediminis]MDN3205142.1 4-(cytidine 5'-diphospho)-2-C-methyl-D-erythritol kinase [Algoriphagus sediminis]
MLVFPNAKINLGLHIISKRHDGFHEIETCMIPIPLTDALEIIPSKNQIGWDSSGLDIPGSAEDNLVVKAFNLLKNDFPNIPFPNIHLHKHIPLGAGLGGGSADAAFALKVMNDLFNLHLDSYFLEEYASKLGSDCAFFIENLPKIARGRGEILEPIDLDLEDAYLVLVNPGIHIGTKEAYAGVIPAKPKVDLKEILTDKARWKNELVNDFEASIFPSHPEISQIKESLYSQGAFYSAMSGSGSSVFGLFSQKPNRIDWPKGYFVFEDWL